MLQELATERYPAADFFELSGRPHVQPDTLCTWHYMHLTLCTMHYAVHGATHTLHELSGRLRVQPGREAEGRWNGGGTEVEATAGPLPLAPCRSG
jgi:hypothetical protein